MNKNATPQVARLIDPHEDSGDSDGSAGEARWRDLLGMTIGWIQVEEGHYHTDPPVVIWNEMHENGVPSKSHWIPKMDLVIYFDTKYDQCVCFRNGSDRTVWVKTSDSRIHYDSLTIAIKRKYNYDTQCITFIITNHTWWIGVCLAAVLQLSLAKPAKLRGCPFWSAILWLNEIQYQL